MHVHIEIVEFRGQEWLVTHTDQNGWLYLKALTKPSGDDLAYAENRIARRATVVTTGRTHPLYRLAQGVKPGDYVVAASHLGPNAPTNIVGRVETVERDGSVDYWRADGAERQTELVRVSPVWLLVYNDPAVGEAAFRRDTERFAPRAAAWWKDGQRVVYDAALARLQAANKKTTVQQMSLGDLGGKPKP